MRILLDECVPARLGRFLAGHAVSTVQREHWAGRPDRGLLDRAAGSFDVLVTVDKRLVMDSRHHDDDMPVVLLRPKRGTMEHLLPLVPRLLATLEAIREGEVVLIEAE